MTEWKKPAKIGNSFADVLKITGLKPWNYTYYVELDGLISSDKFKMKLAEFDKIIQAGRSGVFTKPCIIRVHAEGL